MNGAPKCKMNHVSLGRYVVRRLELARINLCSKDEVSMFTHYKDTEGTQTVETGVVWGVRGYLSPP